MYERAEAQNHVAWKVGIWTTWGASSATGWNYK